MPLPIPKAGTDNSVSPKTSPRGEKKSPRSPRRPVPLPPSAGGRRGMPPPRSPGTRALASSGPHAGGSPQGGASPQPTPVRNAVSHAELGRREPQRPPRKPSLAPLPPIPAYRPRGDSMERGERLERTRLPSREDLRKLTAERLPPMIAVTDDSSPKVRPRSRYGANNVTPRFIPKAAKTELAAFDTDCIEKRSGEASPDDAEAAVEVDMTPELKVPAEPTRCRSYTRRERLRTDCLNEIWTSERDYVNDLDILVNVYLFPLRAMNVVEADVQRKIFSNVELLAENNRLLLERLDEVMEHENPDTTVGEVFSDFAGQLYEMYKVYCANQDISLATYEKVAKKPAFQRYLKVCHTDRRCRGLPLPSFLIKPVQRICKYPLLLRELLKHTSPTHADHATLQPALERIQELVNGLNEWQRAQEERRKLEELQTKIHGCPDLSRPGRDLLMNGILTYHRSKTSKGEVRYVFLFSDILLVTKKMNLLTGAVSTSSSSGLVAATSWPELPKLECRMVLALDAAKMVIHADNEFIKNAFEVESQEETEDGSRKPQNCLLSCAHASEQNAWCKKIKAIIKEYQRQKVLAAQKKRRRRSSV